MNWEQELDGIVCWAEKYGYICDLEGSDNCMCPISKIIELDALNFDIELKVIYALHECGHVLIYKSPGALKILPSKMRESECLTLVQKMKIILEEVDAWARGRKLAHKLGIIINEEKWELAQAKALAKYMKAISE